MVRVYLSAPIIQESQRKDEFNKLVITILEEKGHQVFAPQYLPPSKPSVIFQRDVHAITESDILVAEVTSPSLGVGMEIMLAIQLEIPVLLFYNPQSTPLSKMVRGAEGIALFEYQNLSSVETIFENINLEYVHVGPSCVTCNFYIREKVAEKARCIVCGRLS